MSMIALFPSCGDPLSLRGSSASLRRSIGFLWPSAHFAAPSTRRRLPNTAPVQPALPYPLANMKPWSSLVAMMLLLVSHRQHEDEMR